MPENESGSKTIILKSICKSCNKKSLELIAEEQNVIITICMYCKDYIGMKDGEGEHGVSHGVCKRCEPKVKQELEEMRNGKMSILS